LFDAVWSWIHLDITKLGHIGSGLDRGTARATLGEGLAVSAFPLYVPV
jgi:hypothetical protein